MIPAFFSEVDGEHGLPPNGLGRKWKLREFSAWDPAAGIPCAALLHAVYTCWSKDMMSMESTPMLLHRMLCPGDLNKHLKNRMLSPLSPHRKKNEDVFDYNVSIIQATVSITKCFLPITIISFLVNLVYPHPKIYQHFWNKKRRAWLGKQIIV